MYSVSRILETCLRFRFYFKYIKIANKEIFYRGELWSQQIRGTLVYAKRTDELLSMLSKAWANKMKSNDATILPTQAIDPSACNFRSMQVSNARHVYSKRNGFK